MKKLNLKKIQIAAIGNIYHIFGKSANSNADTICNNTGNESVTCETNCITCTTTHENSPCNQTTPGTTRANGSVKTKKLNCLV